MHEMWIQARAKVNAGWEANPRHELPGRHRGATCSRRRRFRLRKARHGVAYARTA